MCAHGVAVMVNAFTRRIHGSHLGRSLDQSLTLTALHRALVHHPLEVHHSDQAVQYMALAYVQTLQPVIAQISMAEAGAAWHAKRGYAGCLIRAIREEEVDLSDNQDYSNARRQLGRSLDDVYVHKRIHSSLAYRTRADFEDPRCRKRGDGC